MNKQTLQTRMISKIKYRLYCSYSTNYQSCGRLAGKRKNIFIGWLDSLSLFLSPSISLLFSITCIQSQPYTCHPSTANDNLCSLTYFLSQSGSVVFLVEILSIKITINQNKTLTLHFTSFKLSVLASFFVRMEILRVQLFVMSILSLALAFVVPSINAQIPAPAPAPTSDGINIINPKKLCFFPFKFDDD